MLRMSFFKNHRRAQPALQDAGDVQGTADLSVAPTLHGDTASVASSSPRRRRISALSLISLKLSPRPKRNSTRSTLAPPVGHTAVGFPRTYTRESTPSPTPSLDEIRMPAGLGRIASQKTLSADCEQFGGLTVPQELGIRCSSSPNLTGDDYGGRKDVKDTVKAGAPVTRLPPEILASVFSYGSREDILSLSLVSKAFSSPAIRMLYQTLDLRQSDPARAEQCIALLASRKSLAGYVHDFACNALPSPKDTSESLTTVTFAIAFNNMDQLQSLTIPWFDAHVLLHTTFRLTRLTVLSQTISADQFRQLLSWLVKQPDIVSLSFPYFMLDKLIDYHLDEPHYVSKSPPDTPTIKMDDMTSAKSRSLPANVLPRLKHLQCPTALMSAVVPGRPVVSAVLHIHTTLYDGLKPSAIMSSLTRSTASLTHLTIKVSSSKIDARTLERVFMAAGAELGSQLEVLEVQWVLEDEILYKQILSVMPRLRTLHTLRLHRRLPPPSLRLSPDGLPTPPPSAPLEPPSPMPSLLMPPQTPRRGSRPSTATSMSDIPLPRAHERSHLGSWSKHCPTLRDVVFLSGAVWRSERISPMLLAGESLYAPGFRFVGFM